MAGRRKKRLYRKKLAKKKYMHELLGRLKDTDVNNGSDIIVDAQCSTNCEKRRQEFSPPRLSVKRSKISLENVSDLEEKKSNTHETNQIFERSFASCADSDSNCSVPVIDSGVVSCDSVDLLVDNDIISNTNETDTIMSSSEPSMNRTSILKTPRSVFPTKRTKSLSCTNNSPLKVSAYRSLTQVCLDYSCTPVCFPKIRFSPDDTIVPVECLENEEVSETTLGGEELHEGTSVDNSSNSTIQCEKQVKK